MECFSQLVDQLNAYSHTFDPLYYSMQFIDGLHDDVKFVVMVQRPRNLDAVFVLAQLQEEIGDKKHDYRRLDVSSSTKSFPNIPLSLLLPSRASAVSKPEDPPSLGMRRGLFITTDLTIPPESKRNTTWVHFLDYCILFIIFLKVL